MRIGIYVSHPEVAIDPKIDVPNWGLSPVGRARAEAFTQKFKLANSVPTFSSTERKAMELAKILQPSATMRTAREEMGENDRSATGFLPSSVFESHVEQFFAHPERSYNGWERAIDAQKRIHQAVKTAIEAMPDSKIVFCGHGGVGTLLKCALDDRMITQSEDQRLLGHAGGGNCFAFDLDRLSLLCDWTPMEQFEGLY